MTKQINMHEAKSRLSELAELVWQGERVIIAKAGKPYLDLLPHKDTHKPRVPGRLKGQIKIAPDFDTTPPEVIETWRQVNEKTAAGHLHLLVVARG